jgi:hypothetical protein
VRDIQAIRLQNLTFLLQECEAELGRAWGAQALLASKTGVAKTLISMLLSGAVHSESGGRRLIGDDTATKLESGMGKPPGWMDADREAAQDWREAAVLDKLRKLSAPQREAVERLMDAFVAPDAPKDGGKSQAD